MNPLLDVTNLSDDFVLESVYDIEHVLGMLQEITEKIDWYKGVKTHRAKTIDSQMKYLQDDANRLRGVIRRSMQHFAPNKKTLPFPGVGKVTRRAAKDEYVISDQDAMLSFFDSKGVKAQVVETVEKVDVREAKKLLADFHAMSQDVPGVSVKKGEESISITYDKSKPSDNKSAAVAATAPAPAPAPAPASSAIDELDLTSLEV